MLGFSFSVSWDESVVEFLGADMEQGVFSGGGFEFTVNHNPLKKYSRYFYFTGSQEGVIASPGDDIIWLSFVFVPMQQ